MAEAKLLRIHEQDLDLVTGKATLVRVNPSRDYGWNKLYHGQKSDDMEGETERIIAQRIGGTDKINFFTGDGVVLPKKRVPKFILDDLKKHPLVAEEEGGVETLHICVVCNDPWPSSTYPKHLEGHIKRNETPKNYKPPKDEPSDDEE